MSCSEASKKAVKKYTSAILIIMILWILIGFLFSKEYLRLEMIGSLIVGFVLMIIIIQIERQIILGSKSFWLGVFRFSLGLIMAFLGAIVIDQLIFKEDILKEKRVSIDSEINKILPKKIKEINIQINDLSILLDKKERERELLIDEITKKPTIRLPSSETQKIPGKTVSNRDTTLIKTIYSTKSISNPKIKFIPDLDNQIVDLRKQKTLLSTQIIDIRKKTETELLNSKGFLDELELMVQILKSSNVSLLVWFLWLSFFLLIESLVLFSKLFSNENDYDVVVKHQMNVKIDAINKITNFEKK